jgi:hypothetical protein
LSKELFGSNTTLARRESETRAAVLYIYICILFLPPFRGYPELTVSTIQKKKGQADEVKVHGEINKPPLKKKGA